MAFYEPTEQLDGLKKLEVPSMADLERAREIYTGDQELTRYFYDKNDRGSLQPGWVELLDGAGEFADLGTKEPGIVARIKAFYLVDCASVKANVVLGIIKKINAKDFTIQDILIDALLKMPEEIVVGGVPVVLEYIGGREYKVWFLVGERAAKLMVKLVENHPKEAFEIAALLLDAWVPLEKERRYGEDIVAKFSEHDYKKLVLEHYSKVWEVEPERAVWVLVKILNRCIETLNKEEKREGEYDASIYFGYGLELGDLDAIDIKHPRIRTILVKGICEAGKTLIRKKPTKISEFMNGLEKDSGAIFLRIIMYLLRFVPAGVERDRITKFIGDEKYFVYGQSYWYEHRRLLNDKFDDVSGEAKQAFVEWINKPKLDDELRKEIVERCKKNGKDIPNFEKEESREKAGELYLVRERFKDLYEKYKKQAGVKEDSALEPRRMVSETRRVSPTEGSPYSSEKMRQDNVEIVVDYLLEPKNYAGKEEVSGWGTAEDALRATFKEDVKKRPIEYLKQGAQKLENLPAQFLSSFFYAVLESVRDGSFGKERWGDLIELAHKVVQAKYKEEEYRDCFSAILSTLRDGFSERENKIEFDEVKVRKFWGIIEPLVHFPIQDTSGLGEERDPVQLGCNMVVGQALELTVPVGLVCKRHFQDSWEKYLREERRKCYEYVLSEIRQAGVNYVFGLDFARIYWTDRKWVEENIENIFCDELWDETWGTYVSWGRPSLQCFKFLVEKGIYGRAVQKIGEKNKYKFGEEPDEGLVEHLMIGFFNGWIDFEHEVLKQFFEKASAGLRGKAARFLTTGFKSLNEEGGAGKDKVVQRMREYWTRRLSAITGNPEKNKKEAKELTGWVQDSVLAAKETLEVLEQTLDLSGGEIGEMRDAKDFIEGVCRLGKGNELLALQCLKKAAADENMHTPWSGIQDQLVKFLGDLPEDLRSVGREVADLYGRYNPDKFRDVWEKLAG